MIGGEGQPPRPGWRPERERERRRMRTGLRPWRARWAWTWPRPAIPVYYHPRSFCEVRYVIELMGGRPTRPGPRVQPSTPIPSSPPPQGSDCGWLLLLRFNTSLQVAKRGPERPFLRSPVSGRRRILWRRILRPVKKPSPNALISRFHWMIPGSRIVKGGCKISLPQL